jgi:PhoPQ-activated pathogenicity-related protein
MDTNTIPIREDDAMNAGPGLIAAALLLVPLPAGADLNAYLKRPEPKAAWTKGAEEVVTGVRVVSVDLTSQVWRGIPWKHDLRLFIPEKPEFPGLAALLITGGRSGPADRLSGIAAARALGIPFAILYGVPNQPLFGGKFEDDLIAHTFQEFVKSGEADWPLLFPMVKSAVKAMDVIQAVTAEGGRAGAERFVLTGASKRGWTTWLTGAVDPRVAGIAPLVFDNLNFAPQMKNQLATWGAYSHMIGDYTRRNLQALLETEAGKRLAGLVDPWAFRDRLERIPKLIVNGTNDPYWTVDAITFYWDGLKGEKAVLYVPNGGHGLSTNTRAVNTRVAFTRRLGAGRSLPPLRWQHGEADGALTLTMTCAERPAAARVWIARAPTREFRKARWESQPVPAGDDGAFVARVDRPGEGYLAWFGEADFREGALPFNLSTTVRLAGDGKQ